MLLFYYFMTDLRDNIMQCANVVCSTNVVISIVHVNCYVSTIIV